MSIADLAARDGVSKPAVSRKVKQLVEKHGLAVERDGHGRVAGVNVAQYDELRSRFGDPSKFQASGRSQPTSSPPVAPNETYDEALRVKTWTEAERSRIRLAQEMGELVLAQNVAEAQAVCAEEITRVIDRLMGSVDEMAAAVGRDGAHGLRVLVKQIVFRMKTDVANALETVASRAPETEQSGREEREPAEVPA